MDIEDKKRFEAMYLEYQETLRRLAYAYDIPPGDIDDIVQDTFVAYAHYDYSLEQPSEIIRMLLGKILKSRCMDYHRKLKREPSEDLDDEDMTIGELILRSESPSLLEGVISRERCLAILEAIANMPPNWRDVAALKLIEGRSTNEVCKILNISEKACYSRVSRIRKYIETLLNDDNWP